MTKKQYITPQTLIVDLCMENSCIMSSTLNAIIAGTDITPNALSGTFDDYFTD
jgi:hypothetical protein